MKIPKTLILSILISVGFYANAHVPFLKPNQFIVLHNRLQIESSFTEFPFQPDFAMDSPCFSIINPDGRQTTIVPAAKTSAAEYLEPTLNREGTYRINAGLRKGPKYNAIETADGKLYFADDIKKKQGKMTTLQYFSSADTYLAKGEPNYKPQMLNEGIEIIPSSSPNKLKTNKEASFKVYKNGKPAGNVRVIVAYNNEYYAAKRLEDLYDVENSRKSNLYTDEEGAFTFVPEKTGLVLLFVTIHQKADDLSWESYNTSLTLEVNLPDEAMN